tara:strand:+ start:22818 stop:23537 length:720 start_codon:yes stop_codon:yes gene_type:complete
MDTSHIMYQVMERRHNYKYFDPDKSPSFEEIYQILSHAIKLTPVKNNNYLFYMDVFGPHYKEMKKELVLHTICRPRPLYDREETFTVEEAKKTYEEFVTYTEEGTYEEGRITFNTQVLAPWVIKFSRRPSWIDENMKKELKVLPPNRIENLDFVHWYIAAGMMALNICHLANMEGMDASFCQCFTPLDGQEEIPLMGKAGASTWDRQFLLCIGYKSEDNKHLYRPKGMKPRVSHISKFH